MSECIKSENRGEGSSEKPMKQNDLDDHTHLGESSSGEVKQDHGEEANRQSNQVDDTEWEQFDDTESDQVETTQCDELLGSDEYASQAEHIHSEEANKESNQVDDIELEQVDDTESEQVETTQCDELLGNDEFTTQAEYFHPEDTPESAYIQPLTECLERSGLTWVYVSTTKITGTLVVGFLRYPDETKAEDLKRELRRAMKEIVLNIKFVDVTASWKCD